MPALLDHDGAVPQIECPPMAQLGGRVVQLNLDRHAIHRFSADQGAILRWLGVAGEASWSTVPDAIGDSGVSAAFDETDLGGTTFRVKITIGR